MGSCSVLRWVGDKGFLFYVKVGGGQRVPVLC